MTSGLRRAYRRDDGMTLIEMIVALGILTTMLLATAATLTKTIQTQSTNELRDKAVYDLNDTMQNLRGSSWSTLAFNTTDPGYRQCSTNTSCPVKEPTVTSTSKLSDPQLKLRPMPLSTFTKGGVLYTQRVDITWAADPALGITNPAADGSTYTYKRIIVRISWNDKGTPRSVSTSTTRSPSTTDAAPPAACTVNGETVSTSGDACKLQRGNASNNAAGTGLGGGGPRCPTNGGIYCVTYVTQGGVISKDPGFPTTVPVRISVRMYREATGLTATINGTIYTLATADDGKNWTFIIPAGTANVLRPGLKDVTFKATGGTSYSSGGEFLTIKVNWFINFDTTTPIEIVNTKLRANTLNTTNIGFVNFTGTELTTPWLCVNKKDGKLFYYHIIEFDVKNVNDMDASGPDAFPGVTWTGQGPLPVTAGEPARTHPKLVRAKNHPSADQADYEAATGRVGPVKNTVSGLLNTVRWYHQWPAGTVFTRDRTTVTLTAVRPGDGAIASRPVTVQVYYATTLAGCASGDGTTQPAFGTP